MRLLCSALLAVAGSSVFAADPPSAPNAEIIESPEPLRSALQLVWSHSPELASAQADLAAAQARATAADQPLYNPTVSVEGENADVNRRTASLGLALDLSGKRRARAAQGQAELGIAQATFDIARRDLTQRWLKAWSAATLAMKQSEFGRRRVELMRRFDALAEQRLKVGDISTSERDLAGLALGEAQLQLATLLGNEAGHQAQLAAIAGSVVPQVTLPEALPPQAHDLSARDIAQLPEQQLARAKIERGDAAVVVARRNRVPDPTVSLTGGQVRSTGFDRTTDRVIGLSVSIPLPVLNTGRAEVSAAQAEADAAAASQRAQDLALRAAQQETRARYEALRTAVEAFRGGRAGALDERTSLLEKLWRSGEISTAEYLIQLKQSLDTAVAGVDAQAQAWSAWFDYLSAAGRLTDWLAAAPLETSP